MWDSVLQAVLDLLRLLNKLNNEGDEGNIVPYATFHLPELVDLIDIRADYIKWISEKDYSVSYMHDTFLNYPIVDILNFNFYVMK